MTPDPHRPPDPAQPPHSPRLTRLGRVLGWGALLALLFLGVTLVVSELWDRFSRVSPGAALTLTGAWLIVDQGLLPLRTGAFRLWLLPSRARLDMPVGMTRLVATTNIGLGALFVMVGLAVAWS